MNAATSASLDAEWAYFMATHVFIEKAAHAYVTKNPNYEQLVATAESLNNTTIAIGKNVTSRLLEELDEQEGNDND